MKKNVKKIIATIMTTLAIMSTFASTSLAAGNGRIGVVYYNFNYGATRIYVGDINCDGYINMADVVALRRIGNRGLAIWNAEKVCDCNGDWIVDSRDADALLSYVLYH